MQSYTNLKRVKRQSLLAKVLMFGGLGVLGLAVLLNFQNPEQYLQLVLLLAIVGVVMFQIGMPMQNRWNREPRLDQILDQATKGLDRRYSFFHYYLGVDHALITPSGVFAVVPRLEQGMIHTDQAGNLLLESTKTGFLRRRSGTKPLDFVPQLWKEAKGLEARLEKDLGSLEGISIRPYLVFVHPETTVRVEDKDFPVSHIKKFKSDLRKLPKSAALSDEQVEALIEIRSDSHLQT